MENLIAGKIKAACAEAGLSDSAAQRLFSQVLTMVDERLGSLSSENERLKAEVQRYEKVNQELVMLLKAKSPAHIVHDLRNVLNELALLKAVAGEE